MRSSWWWRRLCTDLWRWNFARCPNLVVQWEYGPGHRLSREIFSDLITSSDYVSFNLTATSLFSVDCLLPSPSPSPTSPLPFASPTSPLPFASPSSSHHFPYPHRKGPWDSRVSLLQCWCHQLSSDGGCSVKDLCVSRALHPSTADPFHWLQLWRFPTVQHPQVWSCVSEWACHMTITWLSHAIKRMTATCCSLVHYCHMIVTWLSRDCHITVTYLLRLFHGFQGSVAIAYSYTAAAAKLTIQRPWRQSASLHTRCVCMHVRV